MIPAINRWCVSGTIIKTDFDDLKVPCLPVFHLEYRFLILLFQGALVFLKCENKWEMKTPELLAFLKTISWRHGKKDVEGEIAIPEPVEVNTDITLAV